MGVEESSLNISFPLFLLAFASIFVGFLVKEMVLSNTIYPMVPNLGIIYVVQDMMVMVVEQVKKKNIWMRKQRESHWIAILDTLHPSGMNLDPWPRTTTFKLHPGLNLWTT